MTWRSFAIVFKTLETAGAFGRAFLHNESAAVQRSFLVVAGIVGVLLASSPSGVGVAYAQPRNGDWSPPSMLLRIESSDPVREPLVLAGRNGTVHAFWVWQAPGMAGSGADQRLLDHALWDGKSWKGPVDIVATSMVRLSGAAVDASGNLHLLWQGPDNTLNYMRSRSPDSVSARDWTSPLPLAQAYPRGQIIVDPKGRLHAIYSRLDGRGVYHQVSGDGGKSWSYPAPVAATAEPNTVADWVRLAVGADGVLHVVWTEFGLPDGWPPERIRYSRSANGGTSWTPPVELAGWGYDQGEIAVVGSSMVHVAWNGMAGVGGRYHRWSENGGNRWSGTTMVVPGGGTEGPPQLAVDSAGILHLLTTAGGRVWYSSWRREQGWATPEYVRTGDEEGIPPLDVGVDYETRHIEEVSMAIEGGNLLHALFWDRRVQKGITYVWYVTRPTGAPAVALIGKEATATPTAMPTSPTPSAPFSTQTPPLAFEAVENEGLATFRTTMLASVWWTAILVGGFVVVMLLRNR